MIQELLKDVDPKMQKALEHLGQELASIRTGRATTSLVDGITVDVYGQIMPLRQIATLGTPDAHTIAITPWDRSNLEPIEKAIRDTQSLGLTPNSDGQTIRLNIPQLTEERRKDIVKSMREKIEACHIAMRNIRHEALEEARKLEKAKQATQDELRFAEEQLNKKIDQSKAKVAELEAAKEKEIMAI